LAQGLPSSTPRSGSHCSSFGVSLSRMLCEESLERHVSCVKDFLREARIQGLAYEPGTFGVNDRCSDSRQHYFSCVPQPLLNKSGVGFKGAQCEEVEDNRKVLSRQFTKTQTLKECDAELNEFGQCVEMSLRQSLHTGEDYIFLRKNSAAPDKCAPKRIMFDQCIHTITMMNANNLSSSDNACLPPWAQSMVDPSSLAAGIAWSQAY